VFESRHRERRESCGRYESAAARYLTGTRQPDEAVEEELLKRGLDAGSARSGSEEIPIPQGEETYILFGRRAAREREAIRSRFSNRMGNCAPGTWRMRSSRAAERPPTKWSGNWERSSSVSAVSDMYDLDLRDTTDGVRLICRWKEDRKKWRESREGAYLLRTNLTAETAEQFVVQSTSVDRGQASFRALKSRTVHQALVHQWSHA